MVQVMVVEQQEGQGPRSRAKFRVESRRRHGSIRPNNAKKFGFEQGGPNHIFRLTKVEPLDCTYNYATLRESQVFWFLSYTEGQSDVIL